MTNSFDLVFSVALKRLINLLKILKHYITLEIISNKSTLRKRRVLLGYCICLYFLCMVKMMYLRLLLVLVLFIHLQRHFFLQSTFTVNAKYRVFYISAITVKITAVLPVMVSVKLSLSSNLIFLKTDAFCWCYWFWNRALKSCSNKEILETFCVCS